MTTRTTSRAERRRVDRGENLVRIQMQMQLPYVAALYPRFARVPIKVTGQDDIQGVANLLNAVLLGMGYKTRSAQAAVLGTAINMQEADYRRLVANVIVQGGAFHFMHQGGTFVPGLVPGRFESLAEPMPEPTPEPAPASTSGLWTPAAN